MAVFIVPRRGKRGTRFHVRYQAHRYSDQVHLGSFSTKKAAQARRAWAETELAAGRIPNRLRIEPDAAHTIAATIDVYLESRIDLAPSTIARKTRTLNQHVRHAFPNRSPHTITPEDVQAWLNALAAKSLRPSTIRLVYQALAQLLDYSRVNPNPARDPHVRLPRSRRTEIELPTRAHLAAIYQRLGDMNERACRFLEATGLRVGELAALEWRDVDPARSRILVRESKTRHQRWVQVDDLPGRPADAGDRERVFPVTDRQIRDGLRYACHAVGVPLYSPHDLRHLHASRLLYDDGSPAEIAARLGHSPAVLLTTYAHVVPPD